MISVAATLSLLKVIFAAGEEVRIGEPREKNAITFYFQCQATPHPETVLCIIKLMK